MLKALRSFGKGAPLTRRLHPDVVACCNVIQCPVSNVAVQYAFVFLSPAAKTLLTIAEAAHGIVEGEMCIVKGRIFLTEALCMSLQLPNNNVKSFGLT